MAEDMEMYLEQVIKKTNPQEYIKILEQDREDFAKEINRLQEVIDKAIEYIEQHQRKDEFLNLNEWQTRDLLDILKGDNK